MNKDEKAVENYLKTLNPIDLKFEPDGNNTPDFLMDNKIAIEVRRLNKNYFDGDIVRGKESIEKPISDYINKLIYNFDKSDYTNSVIVDIMFSEPKKKHKSSYLQSIKPKLDRVFEEHALKADIEHEYEINNFLKINFIPISKKDTLYRPALSNSSFSWVISDYHKNIQYTIDEKAKKIGEKFDAYEEWWLVLVDYIFYGLDNEDYNELKSLGFDKKRFSKIIVISLDKKHKVYEF